MLSRKITTKSLIGLLLIVFLSFSIPVAHASEIIDYQITLRNGEKVTILKTPKELYLQEVDNAGFAVFYVESEKARLKPGELQTLSGINVSVVSLSFAESYAVFRIKAEIIPPPTPPPQELLPEHVVDKIVAHGYALIDAYIKELPGYACSFPNGQFNFTLDNRTKRGIQVSISPACANNKIWRTIGFGYPDGTTYAIVLDGPITGEPGTPNPEAIADAKKVLTKDLSNSNMMVKEIQKRAVRLNLRSENDFQTFIDLMFSSIKLSKPLLVQREAVAELPKGVDVKISLTEPLEIAGVPSSFEGVKTRVDFQRAEKEIKIDIDKSKRELQLNIDNQQVITNQKIEIKKSKLRLETSDGSKEIKILPKEASLKVYDIDKVSEMRLTEESKKPVYALKAEREAKILFLMPVTLKIEARIDAENGNVVSVSKPWWSFLAW